MDKVCVLLGNEGSRHVALRKLKEKRKEMEALLPPQKKKVFSEWRVAKEKEYRQMITDIVSTTVRTALQNLSDIFSPEKLVEYTLRAFEQSQLKVSWPQVMLAYLPLLEENLEAACYAVEKGHWDERLLPIDAEISRATLNILKPFDESMINVEKFQGELRFPIDRVGYQGDRPFDKWLTNGLQEKKPVFFDEQERYIDCLCRFYNEVYWPQGERERAAKAVPPPPPIQEAPKPKIGPAIVQPASPLTLQGRIERIKQGGLR